MCYDTHLFLEIIESIDGIKLLNSRTEDGVTVHIFLGLNGRKTFIDGTEDEITPQVGVVHLINLGVPYLIKSLFPEMADKYADVIDKHC